MDILLPNNLDFKTDIIGYNPRHFEKYAWLIHCIIRGNQINKENNHGYVHLQTEILQEYIGNIIFMIKNNLVQSKIVEINSNNYSAGKYSKSYRLTSKYRSAPIKRIPFTSVKAKRYIKRFNRDSQKKIDIILKKQPDLKSTLLQLRNNIKAIQINEPVAMQYINDLLATDGITKDQYSSYKYSIESISKGGEELYFIPNERTGRVFHNIANLKKELRQFLSYNGKSLHQVDVSNSQVVLFVPLLAEYIYQKSQQPKYAIKASNDNELSITIPTLPSPHIPLLSDDALQFKVLTSQGKFYDHLMKKWGIPLENKGEFKVDFFTQVFFSENHVSKHCPYAEQFKILFPTVYNAVVSNKYFNNSDLPISLQKIEAEIIINGICKRIESENKAKPLFFITVHDSIVCLKKDIAYVQQVMEEELEKKLGFKTKVKSSHF